MQSGDPVCWNGALPLAHTLRQFAYDIRLETSTPATLTNAEIRSRISETGIVPVLRTTSEEDALFAAGALIEAGIPLLEISVTYPGSLLVISRLASQFPDMVVGAGSLFDVDTARRSLDEGAKFLTTDGLVPEVVEFAVEQETVVFPGALTPAEIIAAWKAHSDFVKIIPCDAMGGDSYIRSLKTAFPQVHFIAAGGVNQNTASNFIKAGATALGVGKELIPCEAIRLRQTQRIHELARRFLTSIESARA